MTVPIQVNHLPIGSVDDNPYEGWRLLDLDPTPFLHAALRYDPIPCEGLPAPPDRWAPGDVLRLTVGGADPTHILGVIHRKPESGELLLGLAPAFPLPDDETFGAEPVPGQAFALWRGEYGVSTILRWSARVPSWRLVAAARAAAEATMEEHPLPDAVRHLYNRAAYPTSMGLQYAFRKFEREERPVIEDAAELIDRVRATRAKHGSAHCAVLSVCYYVEAEFSHREQGPVDGVAATAVLWAEHSAEGLAVRAAVHHAIPLWSFVAALAGVEEDHCG